MKIKSLSELRTQAIAGAVKYLSNDKRVIIIDGLNPEDNAMIQALYSRDPRSVLVHLEKLVSEGTKKIMGTFYVGYGHRSIGQCGYTTIFLENVSMLAAKAFQDSALYDGQESSTRYLNMSLQKCVNPAGDKKGDALQKKSMKFYEYILTELIAHLKTVIPAPEDPAKYGVYEKTVKAKAFDIARGFLPAGVKTYVSWTTSLDHLRNRLDILKCHPLEEVRILVEQILEAVKETYPDSFGHQMNPAVEEYYSDIADTFTYHTLPKKDFFVKNYLNPGMLRNQYRKVLQTRPRHAFLPAVLNECGYLQVSFPLDFGSFRDIQRHRPWTMKMPLLEVKNGFFPWYLEQLPDRLRVKTELFLKSFEKNLLENISVSKEELQNYVLMGYTIMVETTGGLPQYVYVAELRTSQTVHPTLRAAEQKFAEYLEKWCSSENVPLALYVDMSPDTFNLKRGTQDIVKK